MTAINVKIKKIGLPWWSLVALSYNLFWSQNHENEIAWKMQSEKEKIGGRKKINCEYIVDVSSTTCIRSHYQICIFAQNRIENDRMYEMFYLITLSKESNSEKFAPLSRDFATYIIDRIAMLVTNWLWLMIECLQGLIISLKWF